MLQYAMIYDKHTLFILWSYYNLTIFILKIMLRYATIILSSGTCAKACAGGLEVCDDASTLRQSERCDTVVWKF